MVRQGKFIAVESFTRNDVSDAALADVEIGAKQQLCPTCNGGRFRVRARFFEWGFEDEEEDEDDGSSFKDVLVYSDNPTSVSPWLLCRETHTYVPRTKSPLCCLMNNDLLSGVHSVGYPT